MKAQIDNKILINAPVCSIYLNKNESGLCAGVAVFERYGSKGWTYEIEADSAHPYSAVDKLLHLIFVSGAKHLIVNASSGGLFEEVAIHFKAYEIFFLSRLFTVEEQNALFAKVFSLHSLLTPVEHFSLETRPLSAQALAQFAFSFEDSDTLPFSAPEILDAKGLLELGNNAMEQLEMVSPDPNASAMDKLFLVMRTPMGERLARFRLFMPIRDPRELNLRYDWIEWVAPHADYLASRLGEIGDIEGRWWECIKSSDPHNAIALLQKTFLPLEQMIEYCRLHKLAIVREWDECFSGVFEEVKNRLSGPARMQKYSLNMGKIFDFIARIDIAVTSAILSRRYGLCRPVIVETRQDENFLQVMKLRHLLVEEQGVAYVANDIVMGSRDYLDLPYPSTVMLDSRVHDGADIHGVMLYGINSSGKSSLMKSIGIAVLLAQSGFHVPASAMKFSLFEGVYTRIISRDNVAKSLSTFGVEMLELNAIFKHAGAKTLVLGDEISHGTETLSAVAIVASTVMELARKGGLFLITTHLHQLSQVKELFSLRQVVSLHLSVRYDEKHDRLEYGRNLRPGRGSSIYGLEFAESLHMDQSFLDNARRLRENLAKEYDVLELGQQKEYIKRYRDVVACECIICGSLVRNRQNLPAGREHHHLMPLCDTHTRQIAEGKIKLAGFIMTPQGLRLEYETQL